MSESRYKRMESKWWNTKPLRGRKEDVRPIDKRRRDFETIVKIERDGVTSYGVKLHDTVCIEYFPDGAVTVRCGAWSTPSTADFITRFSGLRCWKQHNKLWIDVQGKFAPVTSEGVKLKEEPHGNEYYFAEPIVIQKSVVDRAKAKEVREPLQPFLAFAKSFLAMSDGWVMHETCKQVLGWEGDHADNYSYGSKKSIGEQEMYEKLIKEPTEETYLYALCCFALVARYGRGWVHISGENKRVAEKFEYEVELSGGRKWTQRNTFYDVRVPFDRLKRTVYRWVDLYDNVRKVVEVAPTDRALCNVR